MNEDAKVLINDLIMLSHVVAVLSVVGKMSMTDQQTLASVFHVWAAYIRNAKNKTHTAMALRRSRRVIRKFVQLVESDESPLPETVRRVLLRDPCRPSVAEIAAELSHGTCELESFLPEEVDER